MKKIYFSALFCLSIHFSSAQKEANNWYFGIKAGLDFNSGVPVPLSNGVLETSEGCSTVSDSNGNLLFYTDGIYVYNKNHVQMPNGFGLDGGISSTQSALIVPSPGSNTIYYVFTVDQIGGANGFRYSIVDMTLQSGNGDVTTKNTLLLNSVTEKLCGAVSSNGTDIWVMVHEWGTDAFYDYLVTSAGVNLPVVSHVGSVHSFSAIQNTYGQMKFNPQATKVALAVREQYISELFDFDNATGVVSNPITLPSPVRTYGIEFSPDGSKLYTSVEGYYSGTLFQYDLNAGTANDIINSKTQISSINMWALQLGPDGKVYAAKSYVNYLGVIEEPNAPGTSCNYLDNALDIGTGSCELGLPGFISSWFQPQYVSFLSSDTAVCQKRCIDFFDQSTNSPTAWQWIFEGGAPSTSTDQNPTSICYFGVGDFDVTLITTSGNEKDTLVLDNFIHVNPVPFTPVVTQSGDTLFSSSATTYQWYLDSVAIPGATNSFFVITQPGEYFVTVTDGFNCEASSSLFVVVGISSLYDHHQFAVYPLPATGNVFVNFYADGQQEGALMILNAIGEIAYREDFDQKLLKRKIGVSDLPSGVYFLQIKTQDGLWVKKWFKQ